MFPEGQRMVHLCRNYLLLEEDWVDIVCLFFKKRLHFVEETVFPPKYSKQKYWKKQDVTDYRGLCKHRGKKWDREGTDLMQVQQKTDLLSIDMYKLLVGSWTEMHSSTPPSPFYLLYVPDSAELEWLKSQNLDANCQWKNPLLLRGTPCWNKVKGNGRAASCVSLLSSYIPQWRKSGKEGKGKATAMVKQCSTVV